MYNQRRGSTHVHNEATKSRQKRDNDHEIALFAAFHGCNVFLSVSSGSLQKLVTKDLTTEEIENALLRVKELGPDEVNTFVEEILIVHEQRIQIHAVLYKSYAKTFASL